MDNINDKSSLPEEEINDSEFKFDYKRNNISLDEISIEEMGNIKNTDEFAHLQDVSVLLNIVKRRNNGEIFDVYNALPKSVKDYINDIAGKSKSSGRAKGINKREIANQLLDKMAELSKDQDDILDGSVSKSSIEIQNVSDKYSNEFGNLLLDMNDERDELLKKRLARFEEEGNTDGIEKINKIKRGIERSNSLEEFVDYCLNCKIKKIDIEKPQHVFDILRLKYNGLNLSAGEIKECPKSLHDHLSSEFNDIHKLMLCLAFCKYCQNFDPNNPEEHTFMFYTIRNIGLLNKLNYRGRNFDKMDDRSKEFYNKYTDIFNKCIENLLKRNPRFRD